MPDGSAPPTYTAMISEVSSLVDFKVVSDRKIADRQSRLDRMAEWHPKEGISDSILDVSNIPGSHLTPRESEIVHTDATGLAEAIRQRRYTAVEVLEAFCHAATIAQTLTNCLTEVLFEEGLKRAAQLDEHLELTGEVVGPLHGVPVSIKDHICVKGQDTAAGYTSWAYRTVATQDAVVVEILKKAGAVIYVKTANPQTLLSLETNNNIYGRTCNPFNRNLSPGGSSGGESALISLHGSPLGLGTDIGGSIRIPAAHCGLYGLKGSVHRMPHAGLMGSHDGMDAIIGALGPIATSARDLALFCRTMLDHQPWLVEPQLIEIPWKQEIVDGAGLPKKLTFAILWDDGVVRPHPPILDALKTTKEALVAAGHDVVDWEPIDHELHWKILLKLYFLDGGEEYREVLKDDPPVPQTKWILSQVPNGGRPFTVAEIFKINLEREAFRAKIAARWNATIDITNTGRPVDVILSPVAPTLAPPHDTTSWWGYTSYWNLMDYPGVVFPVDQFRAHSYVPVDLPGGVILPKEPRNNVEKGIMDRWDAPTYDNAPISLQLIGRRLNEEKLLAILNVVEKALHPKE